MKRVLIFGGNRFFGKKLVQLLLGQGDHVTIATRGTTSDPFGGQVSRLVLDRENAASIRSAVGSGEWDVVFDNICYAPNEALDACEIFAGKVKRYIFTSSLSVYEPGPSRKTESDFDPAAYPLRAGSKSDFSYAQGKRLAEAAFFQRATFPVCAVRFPIVLGADDYTRRLHFHVEHVRDGRPIGMPNPRAKMSFINSDEAAAFLAWLSDQQVTGPFNACSSGELALDRMLAMIEEAVGRKALVEPVTADEDMSPFGVPDDWYMDTTKAEKAGFSFQNIDNWYPALIRRIASGK